MLSLHVTKQLKPCTIAICCCSDNYYRSFKRAQYVRLNRYFCDSSKLKASNSISQQYNGNRYTFNLDSAETILFDVVDDTKQLETSLQSLHIPTILCKNAKFRKIARHYLPHDFPHSVTPNYLPYTLRTNLGSIFGAANAVLATQSLLYALGLGYGSIPLAATFNWILKDFSGQLLAMYLASRISQGFDAYVRKWRFFSCLYYEAAIWLEAITPIFNSQIMFLVLASVANAGKNICWLSTSASKAHINKYMCKRENLADVTGKAVSQAIAANLMGTSLGMMISIVVTAANTANILPVILMLSSCHILCIYQSLWYIYDPLLNINRCHILLKEFIGGNGAMLVNLTKPDDMAKNEKLLNWRKIVYNDEDNGHGLKYAVKINQRLDECLKTKDNMLELIGFYENIETNYWISFEEECRINIWYKTDANNRDILESMLVVGYLQYIHDDKQNFDVLTNGIQFGQINCEKWIDCLKKAQWNVDNLFIELVSNRIELN